MPLSDLDSYQKNAATSTENEVAVTAGAGSGKTRLLVGRYLHLVKTKSVPMQEIVAITFTEKAAGQMKAAIAQKARELSTANEYDGEFWKNIANSIHTAPISTIHAFCNSLLRKYPREAGLDPLFTILDDTTLSDLMREALDSYMVKRMESEPERMEVLIRAFGMSGLKSIFRTILRERTRLITFLDTYDTLCPEEIEKRSIEFFKKRLRNYLYMLKEFNSLGHGDNNDRLSSILNELVTGLEEVLAMMDSDRFDAAFVSSLAENVKPKSYGSKLRWEQSGFAATDVRGNMKDCLSFLDMIVSYYRSERGETARVAAYLIEEFEQLESRFLELKKNRSYLDHDDTLIETWRLLRNNVTVCQEVARSYKHILIDEFQDTDGLQMDILRMIAGNTASTLFTVGDPKQSIYSFRGADVTIFNDFIARVNVDFKTLKKNYRSTPSLIKFVNHTFGRIMGKDNGAEPFEAQYADMKPHRENNHNCSGVEVVVFENDSADNRRCAEADFIARRVMELKDKYGFSFGDMALILRKGTKTRPYEETFLSKNIPFINLTSGDPFKSAEAYDCANLLGWLCEPNNPVLFCAVLLSPFFHVESEVLHGIRQVAGSAEEMPKAFLYDGKLINHPWFEGAELGRIRKILKSLLILRDRATIREIFENAFDMTDYTLTILADPIKGELSLSVLDRILEFADRFEGGGGDIREYSRLLSRSELISDITPAVETRDIALSILTIHKAKGMEYKVVFLADISSYPRSDYASLGFDSELGIGFNYRDTCGKRTRTIAGSIADETEKKKKIAESKRLFYVGCTRAEDFLIISGGKPSKEPDTMFEKDNWMGWLHVALGLTPEGDPAQDCPEELFEYRRITGEQTFDVVSMIDLWASVIDEEKPAPVMDAGIEKIIKQPVHVPLQAKPEHLSPTLIMDFLECPALYLYKYVYNLKGRCSAGDGGGYGMDFGVCAHRALAQWDFNSKESLLSLVDTVELSGDRKALLKEQLLSFTDSPLYREIKSADEIRREEPFGFVQDDVLLRGDMDLVYRTGEDFRIVDYKTDDVERGEVKKASEKYRIQLGIYALAIYRAEYQAPSKLAIHFLAPGVSHEIPCTGEFLEEISSTLTRIIETITEGDFSPNRSERCELCPYSELCTT